MAGEVRRRSTASPEPERGRAGRPRRPSRPPSSPRAPCASRQRATPASRQRASQPAGSVTPAGDSCFTPAGDRTAAARARWPGTPRPGSRRRAADRRRGPAPRAARHRWPSAAAEAGSPSPSRGQPANSGPAVVTKSGTTTAPARRRTARALAVTGTGPDGTTTTPAARPAATSSSMTPGLRPGDQHLGLGPEHLPRLARRLDQLRSPARRRARPSRRPAAAGSKPSAEVAVPDGGRHGHDPSPRARRSRPRWRARWRRSPRSRPGGRPGHRPRCGPPPPHPGRAARRAGPGSRPGEDRRRAGGPGRRRSTPLAGSTARRPSAHQRLDLRHERGQGRGPIVGRGVDAQPTPRRPSARTRRRGR